MKCGVWSSPTPVTLLGTDQLHALQPSGPILRPSPPPTRHQGRGGPDLARGSPWGCRPPGGGGAALRRRYPVRLRQPPLQPWGVNQQLPVPLPAACIWGPLPPPRTQRPLHAPGEAPAGSPRRRRLGRPAAAATAVSAICVAGSRMTPSKSLHVQRGRQVPWATSGSRQWSARGRLTKAATGRRRSVGACRGTGPGCEKARQERCGAGIAGNAGGLGFGGSKGAQLGVCVRPTVRAGSSGRRRSGGDGSLHGRCAVLRCAGPQLVLFSASSASQQHITASPLALQPLCSGSSGARHQPAAAAASPTSGQPRQPGPPAVVCPLPGGSPSALAARGAPRQRRAAGPPASAGWPLSTLASLSRHGPVGALGRPGTARHGGRGRLGDGRRRCR